MEAELVALATAGATTLVQQMVTDSWSQARGRVAAFFSRGAPGATADEDAVEQELEVSRGELTAAQGAGDDQTVADVEAEWRTRLRRTLLADPAAAAELRALLQELAPSDEPGVRDGDVHNTISGGVQHGPVIQTKTLGSLNFGAGQPGRRD